MARKLKSASSQKHNKGNQSEAAFLDAAELVFAEKGYSGTSMRSVAEKANANLGAIHYYFGSKEALVRKVLERNLSSAVEDRKKKLKACEPESAELTPDFHRVLMAFTEPMFAIHRVNPVFDRMVLRIINDPAPQVRNLFAQLFDEGTHCFTALLRRCNPHLTSKEFYWRLNIIMGSVVNLLTARPELMKLTGEELEFSAEEENQGLELTIESLYQLYMAPPALADKAYKGSDSSTSNDISS